MPLLSASSSRPLVHTYCPRLPTTVAVPVSCTSRAGGDQEGLEEQVSWGLGTPGNGQQRQPSPKAQHSAGAGRPQQALPAAGAGRLQKAQLCDCTVRSCEVQLHMHRRTLQRARAAHAAHLAARQHHARRNVGILQQLQRHKAVVLRRLNIGSACTHDGSAPDGNQGGGGGPVAPSPALRFSSPQTCTLPIVAASLSASPLSCTTPNTVTASAHPAPLIPTPCVPSTNAHAERRPNSLPLGRRGCYAAAAGGQDAAGAKCRPSQCAQAAPGPLAQPVESV
eukprot:365091-Chlamydomonas_euryale.AAC.27